MEREPSSDLAQIGEALVSARAAIDIVASHAASRVTIHSTTGGEILAATRALARSAGVIVEPVRRPDGAGYDIVIRTRPTAFDA
jgi:hypothetical protein